MQASHDDVERTERSTARRIGGWLVALGLAVFVAALAGAHAYRTQEFARFRWNWRQPVPIQVRMEPATVGRIVRVVEAPGEVEAEVEVDISSQVMGRIVKLPVREGDRLSMDFRHCFFYEI